MKICIVIDDYMPKSIKVGAKMVHELAVELVTLGHEVTVFMPDPKLEKASEIFKLDGVTVCCFRSGEIKNVGKVKRAISVGYCTISDQTKCFAGDPVNRLDVS